KDKPDRLVGKGSLDLDIRAQGNSVGVLRKDLNGNASLSVSNGSLAGINLRKALVDGKNELGSGSVAQIHPANFTSRTDFSELVATFNFKNGVISNSIFKMKSPLIQTTGEGKIDTASGSLDYKLATIVSSSVNLRTAGELLALKGVTVPIRVSGRYSEPDIALDFGAASGGNVAKLIAARAAKAAAEIAVATTTVKQNNTNPSAPTKSRKAAGKPVKKSHP
ncbi:MAG: AsmA-like C-terminal region-containing protein, partial [Gallionella sp.]